MKTIRLKPHTGKGKELNDLLRRELRIPDSAKWYEVRFAAEELITVKCEYFATQDLDDES